MLERFSQQELLAHSAHLRWCYRTREVQLRVLEFFRNSLAVRGADPFQGFHVWANGTFKERVFACVPNLFMVHSHYDDIRVAITKQGSIEHVSDALADQLELPSGNAAGSTGTLEKNLSATLPHVHYRNYSPSHAMFWNVDRFLWLDPKRVGLSLIPSSLSLSPHNLSLPFVHVLLRIEYAQAKAHSFPADLLASLVSLAAQSYIQTSVNIICTESVVLSVMRVLRSHIRLQRMYDCGRITLVPIPKVPGISSDDTYRSTLTSFMVRLLRSSYNLSHAYVLLDSVTTISAPHRVARLVQQMTLASSMLTPGCSATHLTVSDAHLKVPLNACARAAVHANAVLTSASHYYNSCLGLSNADSSFKGTQSFFNKQQQWIRERSRVAQVIPCILSISES